MIPSISVFNYFLQFFGLLIKLLRATLTIHKINIKQLAISKVVHFLAFFYCSAKKIISKTVFSTFRENFPLSGTNQKRHKIKDTQFLAALFKSLLTTI